MACGSAITRFRRSLPNEASIIRLIGAVLLEQNDEWQLQHRYMQVEVMVELTAAAADADPMRRLTHFTRSTAPSKAWIPKARPECCGQAPMPRSGAPLGAGLDSGASGCSTIRHAVDR